MVKVMFFGIFLLFGQFKAFRADHFPAAERCNIRVSVLTAHRDRFALKGGSQFSIRVTNDLRGAVRNGNAVSLSGFNTQVFAFYCLRNRGNAVVLVLLEDLSVK